MKNKLGRIAATVGLTIAALTASAITPANATRNSGQNPMAFSMPVYNETRAPIGHVMFCRENPDQCRERNITEPVIPQLTNELWNQLVQINQQVNQSVVAITDEELYGTIEYWTYPQGAGDCEDYVLEKQRLLVALGWPVEALLITVVKDENGLGHAVLTVTTNEGDFLLDNRTQTVRRWQEPPFYTFRKRQSQENPATWVSLEPRGGLFSQMLRPSTQPEPVSSR